MKYLKNYFLFLEKNAIYEFGCVMVKLNFTNWNDLENRIDKSDLFEPENEHYGFETEPHLTLLYGLHEEVTENDVRDVLKNFTLEDLEIKIDGIGNFQNQDFDVLKFNVVKNSLLENINKALEKLPNSNRYPEYNPHITIAYLKKGTSIKYLDDNFKTTISDIEDIIYSKPNGEKISIKFG